MRGHNTFQRVPLPLVRPATSLSGAYPALDHKKGLPTPGLMQNFSYFLKTVSFAIIYQYISSTHLSFSYAAMIWFTRQFRVQITTSYRGIKSRSGVSLNDIIELADPENPLFSARLYLKRNVCIFQSHILQQDKLQIAKLIATYI